MESRVQASRVESQTRKRWPMFCPSALSPQPSALTLPKPASSPRGRPDLDRFKQPALETRFQRLQDTIVAVRNVRGVYNISPAAMLDVFIRCAPNVAADLATSGDINLKDWRRTVSRRPVRMSRARRRPPASHFPKRTAMCRWKASSTATPNSRGRRRKPTSCAASSPGTKRSWRTPVLWTARRPKWCRKSVRR